MKDANQTDRMRADVRAALDERQAFRSLFEQVATMLGLSFDELAQRVCADVQHFDANDVKMFARGAWPNAAARSVIRRELDRLKDGRPAMDRSVAAKGSRILQESQ